MYIPCDSNRGWHREWFYIRNPVDAPFLAFTGGRLERRDSWSWGPSRREKKVEIIEEELQKLVRRGLDGVRVFHTFFRHWVTPLAKRTRSMWMYTGPMDPNRVSPKELAMDKV